MKDKRHDDFEFELHMEMNNKKTKKKIDDTLDFYKENLPLNAVEKLFDETEKSQQKLSETQFSSSYNDFIHKYNQDDNNNGIGNNKNEYKLKRYARSDAENEFLNDFTDKHQAFDYDYSRPQNSLGKIFIASLFVIFLCLIAVLLFKINSLNTQLENVKLQVDENSKAKEKLQTVLIENENMKKMIEDLGNNQKTEISSESVQPNQITNNYEAVIPHADQETEYIVQSGDTLSAISKKFYGTTNLYNKIIERNKLTTENLNENQKLIIPTK